MTTAIAERYPVSAEFHGGDEWTSTGIDFSDYGRMTTIRHSLAACRKLECPAWALNDTQLAEVIVAFLERRVRQATTGTPAERLAAATKKLEADRPRQIKVIDRMCAEYVNAKRLGAPQAKLRLLETQIEGLDSALCGTVAQICGVALFYYRLGYSSAECAAELRMKPPAVRMVCMKLRQTAEAMQKNPNFVQVQNENRAAAAASARRNLNAAEMIALRAQGLTCAAIAQRFGVTGTRVSKILSATGGFRQQRQKQTPVALERARQMADMRKQGKTYKEIAQHFGVASARVFVLLQKAGLFIPHNVEPTHGFAEPKLPGAEMFKVENNNHGQAASKRSGYRETPEYSAWRSICARQNPKHQKYSEGIKLHPRWQSFVAFLFDMGVKPHPKARITRKDKAGHWEPSNVAWVVPRQIPANEKGQAREGLA
jgi:AraC-like DNA-binding protein